MDINNNIINIISELSIILPSEISFEDYLIDIGIDSLKTVQLIIDIEDSFGIRFKDSDLDSEKLQTVGSLIELVKKNLKEM